MATLLRRYWRSLWLGCCAGLPGLASAVTVTLSQFPPNPGVLPGGGWQFTPGTTFANPTPPRAWVNGVYGSVPKAVATDALTLAGRAGPLAVNVARAVTARDAALAVARCLSLSAPICAATAAAAAIMYADYRIKHPSTVPGSVVPSDMLDWDPGQPPETVQQLCTAPITGGGLVSQRVCSDTVAGVASALLPYTQASYASSGTVTAVNVQTYANGNGSFQMRFLCYGCSSPYFTTYEVSLMSTGQTCPASVDALDPQYSIPAGRPVGPDGKCPTARYNHAPIDPGTAADKFMAHPPTLPNDKFLNGVKQAIDQGGQQVPAEITVSGPASQTGTPTVTSSTGPSGTTTVTKTPTYTYNYGGDTITYNTTYIEVTNVNGTTTGTTTSTPPAPTPQDPTDPCTANPDRIGCQRLGQVVDQPTLYTKKPETVEGVFSAFKAAVLGSPIGQTAGPFFTVDLAAGQCPTWTLDIPYLATSTVIDFMCLEVFTTLLGVMSLVLHVVAAFVAYRVAFL